ncbi:MAG TPA: multidrug efflux SMR transporter [Anaerolineaceae bacterium]
MSWLYLAAAIVTEVIGTTLMKFTDGFTRPLPSSGVALFYVISTVFMNLAVKYIDLSIVYAIWSGVGTASITLIGWWFFSEPITVVKIGSIFLIVLGVFGLNSGT